MGLHPTQELKPPANPVRFIPVIRLASSGRPISVDRTKARKSGKAGSVAW